VFLVVMPAREAELNRKSEEQVTSIRKQLKATLEDSERAQSDLKAKLQQTTDLAEKARIEAQMKENEAREAALKEQAVAAIKKVAPAKKPKDGAGASTTPKPGVPAKKLNCDPDKDPLCGSDI
jgi:ABC-type transport system involved in cytochrome bd biosynthesis fused ATPase/permease subunit